MRGQSTKVKVLFYSGYKGEETPRSVFIANEKFPVERILDRQKILESKTGKAWDEYTIKLKGKKFILKIFSSGKCELVELS